MESVIPKNFSQILSSILRAKGAIVLGTLFQYLSVLKSSEGYLLSMNVIETSSKNS